jgi:hypothetical protein
MNLSTPDVVAYVSGALSWLLPTIIAVIALVITVTIQRGNRQLAEAKLKFDLFERRYEFLQLIRNITTISLANDDRYFERMHKEYARFTQFKLLFPKKIADEVDAVIQTCDELWISSENMRKLDTATTEGERERRHNADLRKSIRDNMVDLQKRIEDFIRIDWNG